MRIGAHRRLPRRSAEGHGWEDDGLPRAGRPRLPESPRVRQHITRLMVEMGNRAQAWREAALDAELAFLWWQSAASGDRDGAAASYLAAIEREEKAASEYSRASEACCATLPELRESATRPARSRRRWRLSYGEPS
jgi:hypothetical protein